MHSIYFHIGEYGWEFDCVDTASYLYTAILSKYNKDEAKIIKNFLSNDIFNNINKGKIYKEFE